MAGERRERDAQREAVAELMPERGSILRTADGDVLVFEDQNEKLQPLNLRAVVMPDGEVRTFPSQRFRRVD